MKTKKQLIPGILAQQLMWIIILFILISCNGSSVQNGSTEITLSDSYWWPQLKGAKEIIECSNPQGHGEEALALSLAGLMAKGVNNGECKELVWIESMKPFYSKLYQRLIKRLDARVTGKYDVWGLLEYCRNKIAIDGYVVYKKTEDSTWNDYMDQSFNVACMYAGTCNALLVEEGLEQQVAAAGFRLIKDVRNISVEECLNELEHRLNDNFVITMHPKYTNLRDFAVAYNGAVSFGIGIPTMRMLARTKPVSPVLGWNTGGESAFTRPPSEYGLFNTASNWCDNFVALSANSVNENLPRVKVLNPNTIEFNKGKHFHSFIMSDGDNMQWSIGNFIDNKNYWSNPYVKDIPIGFTSCPVNLSMMAPDAYIALVENQQSHTTIIEYGGGYQYPDLYGSALKDSSIRVKREFARKLNTHMKRTGTRVFGFISIDIDSNEALEAYKIYAEELDNLVGMFAVQYAPYHAGGGEIFWVKNKEGVEIPVVTAKYSLWKGINMLTEWAGTPSTLPQKINRDVKTDMKNGSESFSWTSVHAWSRFSNPQNPEENLVGVTPVKWVTEQLLPEIKVVSAEELLWRIRMEHYPGQTKIAIENWQSN